MPGDDAADLTWEPAWAIRDAILRREVSPVDVVEHFLARIETLDPKLHAFSLVDRDSARAQARAAEAAVRAGETTGVLHGVPMVIKASAGVRGLPAPPISAPPRSRSRSMTASWWSGCARPAR